MKKAIPALAAITLLALTGCANNTTSAQSGTAPTSTQTTNTAEPTPTGPATHKDVKNWAGAGYSDDIYTVATGTAAPSDVDQGRTIMGKHNEKLTYIDVTVDNRKGPSPVKLAEVSFANPAGNLTRYERLGTYLEGHDAATELNVDAYNKLVDIHNHYSGDNYTIHPGEKKTLTLATTSPHPQEVTRATVNDYVELTPTDKKPDPRSSETPTPTETPVSAIPETSGTPTAGKKNLYAGTTTKGNDINFTILPDQTQKEQNVANQQTGAVGAWGKLCSTTATADQLKETGVATTNQFNETFVWRSLKYAAGETNPNLKAEDVKVLDKAKASEEPDQHCEIVMAGTKNVLDYNYDTVTVGRYMGTTQLADPTEIE